MDFNKIKRIKHPVGIRLQDANQINTWWCIGYQPPEYRTTANRDYMVHWVGVKAHAGSGH